MSGWHTSPHDNVPHHAGEGVTRTMAQETAGTTLFDVRVEFLAGPGMNSTVRAHDQAQALQFTIARHPNVDPARTRVLTKTKRKKRTATK